MHHGSANAALLQPWQMDSIKAVRWLCCSSDWLSTYIYPTSHLKLHEMTVKLYKRKLISNCLSHERGLINGLETEM